ncbi:MAG: hypothetical protein ISS91_02605, partial [Candidatus Omnitrophica bacterium]|nr:hypothetical protein [Candidatus Omnitrophota bacterium]
MHLKQINKTVAAIVAVFFFFNTIAQDLAFAQSPQVVTSQTLAVPLKFDDINQTIVEQDLGRIDSIARLIIKDALSNTGDLDKDTLVGINTRFENARRKERHKTQLFFSEEKTLPNGYTSVLCRAREGEYIPERSACSAEGLRYYMLYRKDATDPCFISYTEDEYVRFSRQGRFDAGKEPPRREKGEDKDKVAAKAISRYAQHEIGVDRLIALAWKYGFVKKPHTKVFDYRKVINGLKSNLKLNIVNPNPRDLKNIEKRDFFIINFKEFQKILKEKEGISYDESRKMLVSTVLHKVDGAIKETAVDSWMHSSNSAVTAFIADKKAYNALRNGVIDAGEINAARALLTSRLAHEIGVMTGKEVKSVVDGVPLNALDVRYELYTKFPQLADVRVKFENLMLNIVDLDRNLETRDYAAGEPATYRTPLSNMIAVEERDAFQELRRRVLSRMRERDLEVLRFRAQGLALEAIAKIYKVTFQRIGTLEKRGTRRLWAFLDEEINAMKKSRPDLDIIGLRGLWDELRDRQKRRELTYAFVSGELGDNPEESGIRNPDGTFREHSGKNPEDAKAVIFLSERIKRAMRDRGFFTVSDYMAGYEEVCAKYGFLDFEPGISRSTAYRDLRELSKIYHRYLITIEKEGNRNKYRFRYDAPLLLESGVHALAQAFDRVMAIEPDFAKDIAPDICAVFGNKSFMFSESMDPRGVAHLTPAEDIKRVPHIIRLNSENNEIFMPLTKPKNGRVEGIVIAQSGIKRAAKDVKDLYKTENALFTVAPENIMLLIDEIHGLIKKSHSSDKPSPKAFFYTIKAELPMHIRVIEALETSILWTISANWPATRYAIYMGERGQLTFHHSYDIYDSQQKKMTVEFFKDKVIVTWKDDFNHKRGLTTHRFIYRGTLPVSYFAVKSREELVAVSTPEFVAQYQAEAEKAGKKGIRVGAFLRFVASDDEEALKGLTRLGQRGKDVPSPDDDSRRAPREIIESILEEISWTIDPRRLKPETLDSWMEPVKANPNLQDRLTKFTRTVKRALKRRLDKVLKGVVESAIDGRSREIESCTSIRAIDECVEGATNYYDIKFEISKRGTIPEFQKAYEEVIAGVEAAA